MTTRIEQLEQFAAEDPTDPFNLYALALEYQKYDSVKALSLFQELVTNSPGYVPTYYHLGKLYQETGETALALQAFHQGMVVAKGAGDDKANRELQSAARELEEE